MSAPATYKVIQIAGSSPNSIDDAMRNGLARATSTLRDVDWVELDSVRGHVTGNSIAHFQVEMKVGFRIDDE